MSELSELHAALEQSDLRTREVEEVYLELERRGIDLRDDCGREEAKGTYVNARPGGHDYRSLQLFLNRRRATRS